MSDNILSAICRAMLARDNDRTSIALSGVAINPDAGDMVRCEATNGKILAVCHAHKAGIELKETVVICNEHLPRLVNFYRRNKKALDRVMCLRDATKADNPIISVRQLHGYTPQDALLDFSIPRLNDVCRVSLVKCQYPKVRSVEVKGKTWKVGIGGSHFDLRMLSLIPKILPDSFLPYTNGKDKTIWRSQRNADYVLVMPITVPESEPTELFPEIIK